MSERQPFKLFIKPKLESSSLVIAWNQDAGRVGPKVADYLNKELASRELAEIDPEGFFSLSGVSVEDDIAQFPESKFYWCRGKSLVIFKSDIPRYEWYEFLGLVLDIAEKYCKVKEIYTVGGMVSPGAHTTPRLLLSVANSTEMKRMLRQYDLISDMDYETQDGSGGIFAFFNDVKDGIVSIFSSLWVMMKLFGGMVIKLLPLLSVILIMYGIDAVSASLSSMSIKPVGVFFTWVWGMTLVIYGKIVAIAQVIADLIPF